MSHWWNWRAERPQRGDLDGAEDLGELAAMGGVEAGQREGQVEAEPEVG
jgi:hypothetical protein